MTDCYNAPALPRVFPELFVVFPFAGTHVLPRKLLCWWHSFSLPRSSARRRCRLPRGERRSPPSGSLIRLHVPTTTENSVAAPFLKLHKRGPCYRAPFKPPRAETGLAPFHYRHRKMPLRALKNLHSVAVSQERHQMCSLWVITTETLQSLN